MPERQQIIIAIKNTFKLSQNDNLNKLTNNSDVKKIKNLPELIIQLSDEKTAPKEITMALERTVLPIKQKQKERKKLTEKETELFKQINQLIYQPMNIPQSEQSGSSSFRP